MGNLYVRRYDDRETATSTIPIPGIPSMRTIEKTVRGLLINMNTEDYYVDDSEFDYLYQQEDK